MLSPGVGVCLRLSLVCFVVAGVMHTVTTWTGFKKDWGSGTNQGAVEGNVRADSQASDMYCIRNVAHMVLIILQPYTQKS